MRKRLFFYGWIIVAVAFLSLTIAYAVRYSFTVLSVVIEDEFGWSRKDIHIAYSLMITTYGFSGPVTGFLLDKYGPRRLMPAGGLLIGAGLIGCGFLTELWHLYLFYSLSAAGVACLGMVCFGTLVSKWFERRRGTAWGLAASGTGFGMFAVVGFFIPWLIDNWGFRVAYIVLGILSISIVVPLTAIFTRRAPQELGLLPDGRDPGESTATPKSAGGSSLTVVNEAWATADWTLSRAIRTAPFWMMTGCIFFFTIALYSVMMHQVQHAVDVGFDIATASQAFGVVGLFGMAGKFLWGALSDRIGREAAYSCGIACVLIAVTLFMLLKDPDDVALLFGYALFFGLGYGVAQPLFTSMIADLFQGSSLGSIMGWIVAISGIGSALGPPFAGYIFDQSGSYRVAFVNALVCVILSCVFAWLAAPRNVRRPGRARPNKSLLQRRPS